MMTDLGHEVYLYSNGRNEARCTEHIPIFEDGQFQHYFKDHQWWRDKNWPAVSWDPSEPYWADYNSVVSAEINDRIQPGDFVCLITGWPHAH
jgi:hypothetical protein